MKCICQDCDKPAVYGVGVMQPKKEMLLCGHMCAEHASALESALKGDCLLVRIPVGTAIAFPWEPAPPPA
jgi:hypothetical protein